jgi:putative endonuclease
MKKLQTVVWYVYMLSCSDGTLYTGVTTDRERRVQEHNDPKKAAKYTRARQPVSLVYSIQVENRSKAQSKEAALKKLSRTQKMALISEVNPHLSRVIKD